MMLILLFITLIFGNVQSINRCKGRQSLYEGLGCYPLENDSNGCPRRYDCSMVRAKGRDECFFRGQYYQPRQRIETEFTTKTCMHGCFCDKGRHTCAVFSCPSHFFSLGPGCYPSYGGKCCPERVFCPKNITMTCSVEGQTYNEGTSFSPKSDPCLNCGCEKGFQSIADSRFCHVTKCQGDNNHLENYLKNCAPIYGSSQCCAYKFKCPSSDDKIARFGGTPVNGCRYGDVTLGVGDRIQSTNTNLTCECITPPLATCLSKNAYEMN